MNSKLEAIQDQINEYVKNNDDYSAEALSDGHHTFKNLYTHRTILLALLVERVPFAWKAKVHPDGSMFPGMFIVGFPTPEGMVSYHCELEYWNKFKVPEIPTSPVFDGYTEADVLVRLDNYIGSSSTSLMSRDNLWKMEKIVRETILPIFNGDSIAQSTFLSYYIK